MSAKWRDKAAIGLLETRRVATGHIVRIYCDRLAIQREDGERLTWDELQMVKCLVWGDIVAVEVYPARFGVVNLRHTRHLWTGPLLREAVGKECVHAEFAKDEGAP